MITHIHPCCRVGRLALNRPVRWPLNRDTRYDATISVFERWRYRDSQSRLGNEDELATCRYRRKARDSRCQRDVRTRAAKFSREKSHGARTPNALLLSSRHCYCGGRAVERDRTHCTAGKRRRRRRRRLAALWVAGKTRLARARGRSRVQCAYYRR